MQKHFQDWSVIITTRRQLNCPHWGSLLLVPMCVENQATGAVRKVEIPPRLF